MDQPERPAADIDRLIRRLESVGAVTGEERRALATLPLRLKSLPADADVVVEGETPKDCCLVLDGLVCRYKLVAGGQRQILSFHIAGDMPDLQSLHLPVMDHAVGALTPVRAAFIPHAALERLTRSFPGLAAMLWRETLIDSAVFREWVANVGRRNARQRIAHIICELHFRMSRVGLADGDAFEVPITQAEFGDAAGLTSVHVNRVLQGLRSDGLIVSQGRVVTVPDWARLRRAGDFNPAYLHFRGAAAG